MFLFSDEGGWPHLLAPPAAVGSESGKWSGPGGRVASKALSDPARHWTWVKVGYPSPPPRGGGNRPNINNLQTWYGRKIFH